MASGPKPKKTRTMASPDVDFPPLSSESWPDSGHLPTLAEIIGAIRSKVTRHFSAEKATGLISEILIAHWIDRNILPKWASVVQTLLLSEYNEFMAVRKLINKGNPTEATILRYNELKDVKDKVLDISTGHSKTNIKVAKQRVEHLQSELGVRMSSDEFKYLESQLSDIPRNQKMVCFPKKNQIDPVWADQQERKEKLSTYQEKQKRDAADLFAVQTTSTESDEDDYFGDPDYDECISEVEVRQEPLDQETVSGRRRRQYQPIPEREDDMLPMEMRHVRHSEKVVRDEIYLATTDLIGIGLSPNEALSAVEIVSNRCFGRNFHRSKAPPDIKESDWVPLEPINQNTLPNERSVRDMAERIECQGLSAETKEIQTRSRAGDTITHQGDSTTKKWVGKFYVSGIQINRDLCLPLPTVPVAGESREQIAEQAALGYEILGAACDPPKSAAELYIETDHNKFLAEDVPKLMDLDHTPGQTFCSTHTGLGFCSCMNSSIHEIEVKQGINNIMDGFMVEIQYESKNGSIVGQFVDCISRLVGLQMKHKPWNVSEPFKKFCLEQGKKYEMFLYKDERFGCFPKACAVCLYSRDLIQDFLLSHPDISNRLACLVRDIYSQEYVKRVLAVAAAYGVHLIEPFHATTISKSSNHNTLKVFFKGLHDKMSDPIKAEFLHLDTPWYPGISSELFEKVKKGYGTHVVESVTDVLLSYPDEALKVANFLQGGLQTTLARQRRDYGLSEEFEPEFPIENLSEKARNEAPIHNLAMERACGLVGHRTSRNRHLEATSRSIIINGTKELRMKYGGSFRDFSQAAKRVKEIKINWSKKQEVIAGEKITQKQANNLKIEGRVLQQLKDLKAAGGPFTDPDDIDAYLLDDTIKTDDKRKRMKKEIQYSRDTSLSVPRNNPVFKIRAPKQTGVKSRELTPSEFGINLKVLLEKKVAASGRNVTIKDFVATLDAM